MGKDGCCPFACGPRFAQIARDEVHRGGKTLYAPFQCSRIVSRAGFARFVQKEQASTGMRLQDGGKSHFSPKHRFGHIDFPGRPVSEKAQSFLAAGFLPMQIAKVLIRQRQLHIHPRFKLGAHGFASGYFYL